MHASNSVRPLTECTSTAFKGIRDQYLQSTNTVDHLSGMDICQNISHHTNSDCME